jgi:type 1 fimbriae regulatory protein FimE
VNEGGPALPPRRPSDGDLSFKTLGEVAQRIAARELSPLDLTQKALRHACGYKLANDGRDTRAIQHYLGHRNIMHTVRYTELASDRIKGFWDD